MDHQLIKREVCRLVGCTAEEYAQRQYRCGLDYLQLYLHGLQPVQRELEGSRIFWNWWKNHWAIRDEQFIAAHHRGNHLAIYQNYHDAAMLAAEIRPNARALGISYAGMIGRVIDKEVAL